MGNLISKSHALQMWCYSKPLRYLSGVELSESAADDAGDGSTNTRNSIQEASFASKSKVSFHDANSIYLYHVLLMPQNIWPSAAVS